MKILRNVLCAALLVAGLCGCEKIDLNRLEGTWTEQYDPFVFSMDGSVTYTFDGNGTYHLEVYDVFSNESHGRDGHYILDPAYNNTIVLDPYLSDFSGGTFRIVKLTSTEMEWQKEGTTYSAGTWGSDYRHFVRVK